MTAKEVVSGLYQFSNAGINAFLFDEGDAGLTMIDGGFPKHGDALERELRSIGRDPTEVTRILITHAHPDHLGCARQLSGESTRISMHPADSDVAKAGVVPPKMKPGPGFLNGILFRVLIGNKPAKFPSFEPEGALEDGDVIEVADGLEVIHTPGHTPGHVSLLWNRDRGLLITGDAAANFMKLDYMLGYEDLATGKASLNKLARLDFEAAVFGHGKPILSGASDRFAAKFGQ